MFPQNAPVVSQGLVSNGGISMKSSSCYGKETKQPLSVYQSEFLATEACQHIERTHHKQLTPYQCNTCGLWHLSPITRQTPSHKCQDCNDSHGNAKASYQSRSEAGLRADIIYKEEGVLLRVYPCPFGDGWHLTKYLNH